MGQSQIQILNLLVAYSTSTPLHKLLTSGSALSFPKPTILPPSTSNKGSTTTNKVPASLLCLFGIHQCFHRYVPRHDYLSGLSNPIADALSQDFHLSESQSLTSITKISPQPNGYQVWTPSPKVISSVIMALLRQPSDPE